ncbi:MAG: HAMP domain-containing histidine kinase [Prevotellaceae bacterium]|jgi:signal transduction histidine kinase|nr:HAMP domain-containing histidine kinase [Prevotellaceae bacterium]
MNKRQRKILIIIIVITSLGLIAAQGIWVSGVYSSKKEGFNAVVNEALNVAVTKIWQEEYKEYTSQIIDEIPDKPTRPKRVDPVMVEKQISPQGLKYISRTERIIDNDGIDSIRNIPGFMNDSDVVDFIDSTKSQSHETIARRYFIEQVIERMVIMDVPIEQRVTVIQIDSLLRRELSSSELFLGYELAVRDKAGNVLLNSPNYNHIEGKSTYEKRLFPNDPDAFSEKYYLSVFFPSRNVYLIKQISPFIVIAVILVSIIFSIFIYTLWVILRQKKISEIKGDFISNITHELKTPIATISLAAQMLEDPNVSIEVKNPARLSNMIREQSKHLSYLVEKVLQTSVFERQSIVLKLRQNSLHSIITEAADIMSLQFRNKKANLIMNLDADHDAVTVDKPYFLNVITNLLDNALKYSRTNPEVRIKTVNKENGIIVSVTDNGIGISPSNQARLFEPFFRVPTGNVHDIKGFGLGLNYVKKIMDMSNGSVRLESKENVGTTFFLQLPTININ